MALKKYLIEFLGTFFLTITILFSANPLAVGAILAVLIFLGSQEGEAHYNGAVSLASFLLKKIDIKTLLLFLISQAVGALLAFSLAALILPTQAQVQPKLSVANAAVGELFFTLLLVSTVLSSKPKEDKISIVMIGLALFASAASLTNISGGLINPSVGLGNILYGLLSLNVSMSAVIVYIIAPLLGGTAAFVLQKMNQKAALKKNQSQAEKMNLPIQTVDIHELERVKILSKSMVTT
jgi:aquaporin Z